MYNHMIIFTFTQPVHSVNHIVNHYVKLLIQRLGQDCNVIHPLIQLINPIITSSDNLCRTPP